MVGPGSGQSLPGSATLVGTKQKQLVQPIHQGPKTIKEFAVGRRQTFSQKGTSSALDYMDLVIMVLILNGKNRPFRRIKNDL